MLIKRPFLVGVLVLVLAGCAAQARPTAESIQASDDLAVASPATANQSVTVPVPTPTADPQQCSGTVSGSYAQIDTVEQLAWASYQVVVGRVVRQLPSERVEVKTGLGYAEQRIRTEYEIDVEQRLRGESFPTIRLRRAGGAVGDCTLTNESEPPLAVGDRLLLFLHQPASAATVPTYTVTGAVQGYWLLTPQNTVIPAADRAAHLGKYRNRPYQEIAGAIRQSLAGSPPPGSNAVPRERAPVPPADQSP